MHCDRSELAEPATHTEHESAEDAATVALTVSSGQLTQLVAPSTPLKFPAGQGMQSASAVSDE